MTLAEFLGIHPWPAAHAGEKRLEWYWEIDVAAKPETVWPIVADSSRLNRELQVSEMKFEDVNGHRRGSSSSGGRRHEWLEVPWNWVAGRYLESLRVYDAGYPRAVWAAFHLTPIPTGTRLSCYFGAVPRGPLGWLALKLGFGTLEAGFRRVFATVTDASPKRLPMFTVLKKDGLAPDAEERLGRIRAGLLDLKLAAKAVDALCDWIRTGDELELVRIQVRERARAWGLDEDAVLKVCLHATRLGLLELSWDAVCPHCRGPAQTHGALGELAAKADCAICEIDFATNQAESVEITFHVHPSIRTVVRRTFCSAEPSTKEHIRVQHAVAAGGEVKVDPALARGRYRLRVHGEKNYGFLDVGAGSAAQVAFKASAGAVELPAGPDPSVQLINDAPGERRFILEAAQWTDLALRPGRLLSSQEFRDLFSEEFLSADVQLAIGEQTILFTDIVGSTAMYAQRGDPAAFSEVKKHFADVFAIIAKHRGAVVKTIGDAAMAAFNNPLDAVKASKDIHDAFRPGRPDLPTKLRISLNTGPCIAVRLNTAIDYFGHTVNIAAKLQSLAESWQIAMSAHVYAAPGVAAWLGEQQAALEDVSFASKAISEPIAAKRWSVYRT